MNEDTPSVEIMKYSIKFIITNIITILSMILSGIIFDNLFTVIIAMISFALIRFFSGGIHLKSPYSCIVVSTIVIQMISCFSFILEDKFYYSFIAVITIGLFLLYAPSRIEKQTRIKKESHRLFKYLSIAIVSIGVIVGKEIVLAAFFAQGLTLITKKIFLKGGELSGIEKNIL